MNNINCPICGVEIEVRPARGRKSGKPSLMLICPVDGRHLRAFIADQEYVKKVHDNTENLPAPGEV